jgi:hypothetical protein
LARWQPNSSDAPRHIAAYRAEDWGPGETGIRAWRAAATDWLNAHPDGHVDVGIEGDVLDVAREAVRLLDQAWFGPGRDVKPDS